MQKRRRPFLAAFLNALCLGLGFLYVGRVGLAVVFPVLMLFLIAMAAWTQVLLTPVGFFLLVLALLALWLGSVVLAFLLARRAGVVPLGRAQTGYAYLGFFVASVILLSLFTAYRAKLFGYETFSIPSSSMNETLMQGDFIMANTWAFSSRTPARGEVVVFRHPVDPSILYVKRVIGLPGEVLDIGAGAVRVNGEVLAESYVKPDNNQRLAFDRPGTHSVPTDAYFLMGDNRDTSHDSRFWGAVPAENLYGSVVFIGFSFSGQDGIRWDRVGLPAR